MFDLSSTILIVVLTGAFALVAECFVLVFRRFRQGKHVVTHALRIADRLAPIEKAIERASVDADRLERAFGEFSEKSRALRRIFD